MEVKRLNVPKGTSGLSFRDVKSGSGQGARQTQRAQVRTDPDQSQSSAYQVSFARRSFFFEEDFNDITIEELAQFMERDDDFVEEVDEEAEQAKVAAQTQQPPEPEQPVDKRKVAAVAAYDWFATL